eukprot:308634-Rhodomonas_salina.1
MQAQCPELDGIRQVAHNDIMDALTAELGELCKRGQITVHTRPRVDSMGPYDDERLASYEPDAIIEWKDKHHQTHLVVVEFTRSIREDASTHDAKVAEKTQAYQSTI